MNKTAVDSLKNKNIDHKIGFIVPCFNESKNIFNFYISLKNILLDVNVKNYEIILIDDGSSDNTLEVIKSLNKIDASIKYISFSRNFGKEAAIIAGFKYCSADCAILIDADFQHPLSFIPNMILEWLEGYKIVVCYRKNRKGENKLRSFLSEGFYKVNNLVSNVRLEKGSQDFGLYDKQVYKTLLDMNEYHRFTKGMVNWVGFKRKVLRHDYAPRVKGVSGFGFYKLFKYGISGIVSFSVAPLRVSFILGFIISFLAGLYGMFLIIDKLFIGNPLQGYTSTIVLICFFSGLQFILIGIVGEYIARIYEQLKNRPHFVIEDSNF